MWLLNLFICLFWVVECFHGLGKLEKESEMILKKTLESICLRSIYPNTTTSVIIQVTLAPINKKPVFFFFFFWVHPKLLLERICCKKLWASSWFLKTWFPNSHEKGLFLLFVVILVYLFCKDIKIRFEPFQLHHVCI